MPPQGFEPAFDVVELLFEVFEQHVNLLSGVRNGFDYTIVNLNKQRQMQIIALD